MKKICQGLFIYIPGGRPELNTHIHTHTHTHTHTYSLISVSQPQRYWRFRLVNSFPCGLSHALQDVKQFPLSLSIRCLWQLFPHQQPQLSLDIANSPGLWAGRGGGGGQCCAKIGLKWKLLAYTVLSVFWAPLFLQVYLPTITQNRGVHGTEDRWSSVTNRFFFSKFVQRAGLRRGMALSVQKMTLGSCRRWASHGGSGVWYFQTELHYRMTCGSQSKLSLAPFSFIPFLKHVTKEESWWGQWA